MWREKCSVSNIDIDYALSFQEAEGCHAIWYVETNNNLSFV